MSVLTFRGVRYEQASTPSGSEAPVQQLVYRSPAQEKRVIRSAPTAALLQLEEPKEDARLVYRGVPVRSLQVKRLDRAPIQPGGVLKPQVNRWCSSLLFVGRSDRGAFLIVEQRQVDGPGPVPLREFAGASHVHKWPIQLAELLDLDRTCLAHA